MAQPFRVGSLLEEIENYMKHDQVNEACKLQFVKQCTEVFIQEALPTLQYLAKSIPRYAFYISQIEKDINNMRDSIDMDYVQLLDLQMTNMCMSLFQVEGYNRKHWDTEKFKEVITDIMKKQVKEDQMNTVTTNTLLTLHFCNTFLKQVELLCGSVFDSVHGFASTRCIFIQLLCLCYKPDQTHRDR
jgi:hypothetical protein